MNISQERRDDLLCLRLEGELTIYAAAAVKSALVDALAAAAEIELDLAGVAVIDTAGVQLLIAAKRDAIEAGVPLRLTAHSAAVLELIELYELGAWFGDPLVLAAAPAPRQGAMA